MLHPSLTIELATRSLISAPIIAQPPSYKVTSLLWIAASDPLSLASLFLFFSVPRRELGQQRLSRHCSASFDS
nr:hypothetical protein Q903MT_gene1882 [Picea sitchensis]